MLVQGNWTVTVDRRARDRHETPRKTDSAAALVQMSPDFANHGGTSDATDFARIGSGSASPRSPSPARRPRPRQGAGFFRPWAMSPMRRTTICRRSVVDRSISPNIAAMFGDIKDGSLKCEDATFHRRRRHVQLFKMLPTTCRATHDHTRHRVNHGFDKPGSAFDHKGTGDVRQPEKSSARRRWALSIREPGRNSSRTSASPMDIVSSAQHPGSNNNKVERPKPCTNKSDAHPGAMRRPTTRNSRRTRRRHVAWMHQAFALARKEKAPGIESLPFKGDPGFDVPGPTPER